MIILMNVVVVVVVVIITQNIIALVVLFRIANYITATDNRTFFDSQLNVIFGAGALFRLIVYRHRLSRPQVDVIVWERVHILVGLARWLAGWLSVCMHE